MLQWYTCAYYTREISPLNFQSLGTILWYCRNCYIDSSRSSNIFNHLTSLLNCRCSSQSSVVWSFFSLLLSFPSVARPRVSDLNREDSVRLRERWRGGRGPERPGVQYLGYSQGFKSRAKSPGRLLLRANYRPTRLLPIYPRERALLGYGGRAIDGYTSVRARVFLGVPGGLENNGMRACVRMRMYARRREGGIWRKRKKGTSPKCARLTRGFLALASLTLSYFRRYRANAVSFRSPARDCFIPRFYSSTFIIFFISRSFLEISKSSASNARVTLAILSSSLRSFPPRQRGTMLQRVCIRRIAKRRRDICALQNWIVKVDINSWVDIPRRRSLFPAYRAAPFLAPKYAPAENSHDTPVMKLSRTLLPLRLSSPFITHDYGVRCSVKSIAVCSVKNLFPFACWFSEAYAGRSNFHVYQQVWY